jgi:Immunoglobulin I-set domain
LKPSNRLRTRYNPDTQQVLLQIDNVRPEDVGQYLVVAANPAGKDQTGASLSVVPEKPAVEDQANVPDQGVKRPRVPERRPLEVIPTRDLLKHVPPSTKTGEGDVQEEMRPPRVLVPLKDSIVDESMPVILTTKIDAGSPMATVRYYLYTKS